MSLLDVVTNVGQRAGYSVDTAVISSVDQTTVQLKAMTNDIIKRMGQAYEWPHLFRSGRIDFLAGQNTYALPLDLSEYHFDSFWNNSTKWRIFGPLSESDFASIQGYGLVAYPYGQFQLRGLTDKEFFIYPTPGAPAIVVFEYMSARYVRPRKWATGLTAALNSYIFNNGNYYIAASAGTTGATPPTWTTGTSSDGGVSWTYYAGKYEAFLADTDEPLISSLVLEQGVLETFASQHGIPCDISYEKDLDEAYQRKVPGQMLYAGRQQAGVLIQARSGVVSFGKGFGPY